jgi:choice-of-anchor A domain-containing protein
MGLVVALPLAASALLLAAPGAAAAGPTIAGVLGAAGPGNSAGGFAVLGLGGASTAGVVLTCGNATVTGNIGVGGPGEFNILPPCTAKGNLYIASAVTMMGNGGVTGSTIIDDALISQAVSDAQSASSTFAGMTATDTSVTSVSGGSTTFTATQSGINVVDLTSLSGSPKLTFSCGSFPGCQWIVNDAGAFQFGSGSVTLGSGLTSGDVLFNGYSHGASIGFNPSASVSGIFLAPYSSWQTKGTWNGELIGGLNGMLTVMSGTMINAPPPVTEVPITNSAGTITAVLLIGGGLAVATWRSRRRTRVG